MEKLPLVSIALCTYNGERFLARQLDSLIAQTYKNIEIIAVDDCSGDDTVAILSAYATDHPHIFIYSNENNVGFLKNFEKALGYCNGEFIALCDQDDLWDSRKIELQVAAMGNNQIVYHDSELINDDGDALGKKMSDIFNFYRGGQPEAFLFYNCISGHAMMIRRDLLKHALPLQDIYYHDWWLAYVGANTGTVDFIPQCLVKYRQHNDSSTDLLRKNKVKKNKLNNLNKTNRLSFEKNWLEHCLNYPENKHPEFIKTLFELYTNRFNSFTAFRYWQFLKKNIDVLFYIKKESRAWKNREIRKYIWGMKGGNFWYTYLRPNPDKVVK